MWTVRRRYYHNKTIRRYPFLVNTRDTGHKGPYARCHSDSWAQLEQVTLIVGSQSLGTRGAACEVVIGRCDRFLAQIKQQWCCNACWCLVYQIYNFLVQTSTIQCVAESSGSPLSTLLSLAMPVTTQLLPPHPSSSHCVHIFLPKPPVQQQCQSQADQSCALRMVFGAKVPRPARPSSLRLPHCHGPSLTPPHEVHLGNSQSRTRPDRCHISHECYRKVRCLRDPMPASHHLPRHLDLFLLPARDAHRLQQRVMIQPRLSLSGVCVSLSIVTYLRHLHESWRYWYEISCSKCDCECLHVWESVRCDSYKPVQRAVRLMLGIGCNTER